MLDLLRYRDPSDRAGTAQRAKELRAEGLSLREVGVRLATKGHAPELGGAWYPARELRAEGLSLREVGVRLATKGHAPELGGAWYPARVSALLTAAALSAAQTSPMP